MFDQLGIDVVFCIATQSTNLYLRTSKKKRLDIQAIYSSLCVLLNDGAYIRHVGSEMRRLYFCRHKALHKQRWQIYWLSLGAWHIRKHYCFYFENDGRCSVFFENRSFSCITGFLICEDAFTIPSFHKVNFSSSGEIIFPEMLDNDTIIMPVYQNGSVWKTDRMIKH